jgi:hypothetical protein
VIILLNEECELKEYYTNIRKLIINANNVIVIDDSSSISNQIGMLMCLYEKYGIYKITNQSLTEDYVTALLGREPTIEEIETFINADIAGYAELNNIILELLEAVKSKDVNKVTAVLGDKINEIENFVGLIDYLRTMTNNVIEDTVNTGKELKEEIGKLKQEMDKKDSLIDTMKSDIADSKKSNTEYKAEIIKLNDQINKMSEAEPSLMAYNELQTRLIPCKTQSVVYFKEVSPVNYINSFIATFVESLRRLRQLNVKLIIYEHKGAYLNIYKYGSVDNKQKIQLVTSNDYGSDRDRVVTALPNMLLTEVNQAILQDVLCDSKWDVVVIYDKLKQATDIVSGNNVTKYYILNSIREYMVLEKEYKVKEDEVITRPGVIRGGLTITHSEDCARAEGEAAKASARLSFYFSKMMGKGDYTGNVFNAIFTKANITNIKPRKKN